MSRKPSKSKKRAIDDQARERYDPGPQLSLFEVEGEAEPRQGVQGGPRTPRQPGSSWRKRAFQLPLPETNLDTNESENGLGNGSSRKRLTREARKAERSASLNVRLRETESSSAEAEGILDTLARLLLADSTLIEPRNTEAED